MKKSNQKRSWKQIFSLNFRAIKLLQKRCPQVMLSSVLYTVWNSLVPYAEICLTALVITELSGDQDPDRLIKLVLLTLTAAALSALGTAVLDKWKWTHISGLWIKLYHIYSEKCADMDYIDMESTKTKDIYAKIIQSQSSGGWGLWRVIEDCEGMIGSVLSILGGISLTVSLFTAKIPASAKEYAVLGHPLLILGLIAVMLIITWIAPTLDTKASSYWVTHHGGHNFFNRLFVHAMTHCTSGTHAADMRIYRQETLYSSLNDKHALFGSSGVFAKLAAGPMGLYRGASAAVSCIFLAVVYLYVCFKAWAGAFGIGEVSRYVASITKVSAGVSDLIRTVGDMKNNAAFLEQIFELLDIPSRMYQGSLTVEKRRDRKYEVEFRDVSFRYPGSEAYALKHVNVTFEIGKRLAVVGQNGSGKTTFIKLLCRLYDPTEGEILLNGIDIRKYNYAEYMAIFSIVFQDFKLFSLKLGENVACKVAYDNEKAEKCLESAGFSDRLREMGQGCETYLYKEFGENGVNISGGEAQKIAIARAIYKDAPFIVLDEPTAALDPIAEAEVYQKFDAIAGDKTAIYISHRLSSCKFCDEIMVFHEGSVVQKGTHAALVGDETGKYHELWHAQAQYYTE